MKNDTLKCIYIVYPRTASRSIIRALSLESKSPDGSPHRAPLTSTQLKQLYGDHIWNTYYKFTFNRNPYDREVDFYHWFKTTPRGKESNPSFKEFIKTEKINIVTQKENNEEPLDFIGDFSNLQEDFNKVCDSLKIDHITLPHLGKVEGSYPAVEDEYDEETRELVNTKYSEDLITYNYNFDSIKEKE